MMEWSFPRYLSAKRSVDDRALNRVVWEHMRACLDSIPQPARILEIGAGTGAMFQRLVEWGALAEGHYTLLDAAGENITAARQALPAWGRQRGLDVSERGAGLLFHGPAVNMELELVTGDLFDFIRGAAQQPPWDMLVAHAFLDLVNIPRTLPLLRDLARPGSLFYLTINFDGLTAFEPAIDARLDEHIVALYHQTMDERLTDGAPFDGALSGDSRSGRHLFGWLPRAGFEILAAGSSDWTVFPRGGAYPEDEAYFMHFILHFFEESLGRHPGLRGESFGDWLAQRRAQVERGELVFLAHQFDFLAVQR